MKHVDLTQDRLKELLRYDPDTGLFFWRVVKPGWRHPGRPAGGIDGRGYRQIGIDRCNYVAHRLAWLYLYGRWPVSCIDHINGDRADNRIENLREVTHQENSFNVTVVRAKSGFMGAYWDKRIKRWRASIKVNGHTTRLGSYTTPEAAHEAYLAAKKVLHAIGA